MRILHTSDWHLGRSLHRVDLLGAQAAHLDHLVEVVRAEGVDAVVVSGDVYDRALPPLEAVHLLDDALDRLVDAAAAVLVISGNHDSATRLGFGSRRSAKAGLHLRTHPEQLDQPVQLADEHGPVMLYGIPYLEPALVCEPWQVARSHAAVLGAAMRRIRADLDGHPGARSVVAAHAFVVGGQGCDSERDIRVGGVDTAPARIFDGIDYVALGHLHGRQRISPTIRYSGSPLPYSFSEAGHVKGSWLVDLDAGGVRDVTEVPAPVFRRLSVLRGTLDQLLTDPAHAAAEQHICQVTLTDEQRPRDAMQRIRARFPDTVSLAFDSPAHTTKPASHVVAAAAGTDLDLCCSFLRHVREHEESAAERELLGEALEQVRIRYASA
ncbi:MAG: exonuclease SbcCD subunit D [Micrococcales bacterium]|nr:MAG: exonuclease SbcCD subunit D [Micrococcales bacterium]PIE26673.1 MAG: exonuclease SbcCD subunit D [Micrococcales bacterium]